MFRELVKPTMRKGAKSLGVVVARPQRLYKEWEPFTLGRFLRLYDIEVVVDIGANAGQYATMIRQGAGYEGRIISCEPIPHLADRLRQASAADAGWVIEHCAVGAKPGTATLNITESDQLSSLAQPAMNDIGMLKDYARVVSQVDVPCVTVDALIEKHCKGGREGSIFVKIDTQGWEEHVVAGMRDSLPLVACVQMELSFKQLYENSWSYQQAISCMTDRGFELAALFPNNAGHFPFLLEMDGIFRNTRLPIEAELNADMSAAHAS